MYVIYFDYPLWIPPLIFAVVVDPLHYITGGFYFGALGNATAYSILPISDGGLKYVFIYPKCFSPILLPEVEILFHRIDKKVIEEETEKLKACQPFPMCPFIFTTMPTYRHCFSEIPL